MPRSIPISQRLASAFLGAPWCLDGLVGRASELLGRRPRWLRPLARRVLAAFGEGPSRPDQPTLAAFLQQDGGLSRASTNESARPGCRVLRGRLNMAPCPWPVPSLPSPEALAAWLGLTLKELDWFADCWGREADVPAGPLRHYSYCWRAKSSRRWRLLEMPKARLKAVQRRLLHDLLGHIPAHDAAHAYRRGRSVLTYAAPHAGQAIVLRFDLCDFFPSVRASRVHALFRTAGYPAPVARLLTGLCTNVLPSEVRDAAPGRQSASAYAHAHLPQGAPTSPALANLCAYRLDCRLAALAQSLGAHYTRYADDLAFSGGARLERGARRFQVLVCRVALEEGFEVHTRKSRFMRRGVRQQLAGVVVNERPNVRRAEYDRLKATLCNCARHGPASQNRDGLTDFRAHLLGRIAYVALLNPARGRKLRELFECVGWDGGR
jgi:hypothetical protein